MFETLSSKFQNIFKTLKSKGKLTEKEIDASLREIRVALLEGDVNYNVVKSFIHDLKEKAKDLELDTALNPAQQIISLVNTEMIKMLGKPGTINWSPDGFTIFLIAGLQGSGKTTTCAKLGNYLKNKKKKVLLIAADTVRPAAAEQLKLLSQKCELGFFSGGDTDTPLEIVKQGLSFARSKIYDCVIIDTAGRQQVDDALMDEVRNIKDYAGPHETLLVVDAMTGQEAFNVAKEFNQYLNLTGMIITKTDGDARGGATLSARYVTGCEVKFIGSGEKIEQFEIFNPEQMSSRILGMGDILGFIEKTKALSSTTNLEKKLSGKGKDSKLNFNDILNQLEGLSKVGSLNSLIDMLPKQGAFKGIKADDVDENEILHNKAIIQSMTMQERSNPKILNASRKRRIAVGSGTDVPSVNRLIKQLEQAQQMISFFAGKNGKKGQSRSLFR